MHRLQFLKLLIIQIISVAKFTYTINNCELPEHFDNHIFGIVSVHNYYSKDCFFAKNTIHLGPGMKISLGYLSLMCIGSKLLSEISEYSKSL